MSAAKEVSLESCDQPSLTFENTAVELAARDFAEYGRCSIRRPLSTGLAEQLIAELADHPGWQRTYLCGDKVFTLPRNGDSTNDAQLAILDTLLTEKPSGKYCFRYSKIAPDNPREKTAGSALAQARRMLSNSATVKVIERISGMSGLTTSGIRASHFEPGDYLSQHTDGKREVAFVLGLSKDWNADWGGHLLFPKGDGSVDGILPGFNRLEIFRVPQLHSVSRVAKAAAGSRMALYGRWQKPQSDAEKT